MAIAYPLDDSVPTRRWRTLLRHVPLFPSFILALLVLTAVCAAFLAPHSPTEGDIMRKLVPPAWTARGCGHGRQSVTLPRPSGERAEVRAGAGCATRELPRR